MGGHKDWKRRNKSFTVLPLKSATRHKSVDKDVELRPSAGKGTGVFALRDIAAGAFVERYGHVRAATIRRCVQLSLEGVLLY